MPEVQNPSKESIREPGETELFRKKLKNPFEVISRRTVPRMRQWNSNRPVLWALAPGIDAENWLSGSGTPSATRQFLD